MNVDHGKFIGMPLALMVWGISTGLIVPAGLMFLILWGEHFTKRRWSLSLQGVQQILRLCGVALGLLVAVFMLMQQSIYQFLQWLPICAFPLLIAQIYAKDFPLLLRLQFANPYFFRKGLHWKQADIDLYYPFFALCLLSASAASYQGVSLYLWVGVAVALFLWTLRPKSANPVLWACLFLLACSLSFIGHQQLHGLQTQLERQTAPLLHRLTGGESDPYQAVTAIGGIGELKQSNKIVFRVAGDRNHFPLHLREATYNKYGGGSWVAVQSGFEPVQPPVDRTWILHQTADPSTSITISDRLHWGKGLLRLPAGTAQVTAPGLKWMRQNPYGAVKVKGRSGAITYEAHFSPQQGLDAPPTDADLEIPDAERPAIEHTLEILGLDGQSPSAVAERLSRYFQTDFQYSLKLAQPEGEATPLSAFLLQHHSGHCEYFAAATTLLLRGAGIPARYAVGYSVHEFSPLEKQYIVRSRNAHAWTMAYIDGTWQTLDTTPSDWTATEDAMASPLQQLSDLWSFALFQLSRLSLGDVGMMIVCGGGVAIAVFLWRWIRKRPHKHPPPQHQPAPTRPTGRDSEFYLIEQQLRDINLNRLPRESVQQWMQRLQTHLPHTQFTTLGHIIRLHNRYRFDPQGIDTAERERLSRLSQDWLQHQLTVSEQ